jgi:putative membrane protein
LLGLSYFSFEELWSPMLLFGMIAIGIAYFYAAGPWREKNYPGEAPPNVIQRLLFIFGLALLYLAQGGPLSLLGHLSFTFHMIGMSISYLIVPPMILLGVPSYIWRKLFSARFWSKVSWLMNPLLSLILFNALFSFYHIPQIHDFVMTHFTVHRLYYIAMLIAAFMMWWQIVCPVPEWNRLTGLRKMGYVFANGILLTPACALIIFAGSPMYATYNDPQAWTTAMGYCVAGDPSALLERFQGGPAFFSLMKPVEDQQLGGIVMKLVQEVMYGAILAHVFYHWYKQEHADTDDDLPPNAAGAGN